MKKLMCLMIALLMLPCAAFAWEMGEPVPDDGQPDVFCGLSQQQVDEMFADTLNGLFTGETKEEIVRVWLPLPGYAVVGGQILGVLHHL